jgi:hypothetical protein
MHLAGGWNVNADITVDFGLATQPVSAFEAPALLTEFFVITHAAEVVDAGNNPFLGKIAIHGFNLATPATGPAAADGINIDTQRPGGL